jgi:hypothetical protein
MTAWLTKMRGAVRPLMLLILAVLIGPIAIATGMLEAVFPGAGVRFANGFLEYMRGLPDSFWLFAGTSFGIYTAARSFGQDKKAEAAADYTEIARMRDADNRRDDDNDTGMPQ